MVESQIFELKEFFLNLYNEQNELNLFDFLNSKSYDIIKSSNLFDEDFYLLNYPDVIDCGLDPIEHYVKLGASEKCNPNNEFDTWDYLDMYPDVKKSGLNPFVHYLIYGVHEKRLMHNSSLNALERKYKVSIIMPTFNRKNIISSSIDSVINQTFTNFELIIVDDGSDDRTDEFINNKYSNYIHTKKINYYKLNHRGVCSARNYGLEHSKGNIIAYLDSDNQWDSHYLEYMLNELNNHKNFSCIYCEVKVNNRVNGKEYILSTPFNRKKLLEANFIDLNSFIHEKRLYDSRGGFDNNLTRLVDWDLIIRYTYNNKPLFLNKVLVDYYIDEEFENITIKEPLKNNMDLIHEKYWDELYSEEYEAIKDIFDQSYYLSTYEDVFEKGYNPIYHYLSKGHTEGRNPNSEFVTSFYVNKYPDVIKNKLNPLVHYAKWGEVEGREINYFDKYNSILDTNLIYLSNYSFDFEPLVSIIILNKDGLNHLKVLFKDFDKKTNYSNYEIIVVDNASTDDSVNFLKSLDLPIKIIENEENVSFSKGNNDAVKISKGEYLLLLNNDIEPTYGWLNEMMGTIIYNENVGAVGAKLLYPFIKNPNQNKYSFTIQHAGDIFRENINNGCLYEAHNLGKFSKDIFDSFLTHNKKCLLVTGAVLLTKRNIYDELGGLDENYWYGYEDIDFNLRLYQKGYDVIFASAALLFHHESATPKKSRYLHNHKILCEKWGEFLFKKLLNDKIEKNYFFTDKKLNFLIVTGDDLIKSHNMRDNIHCLTDFFINQDYKINFQNNLMNFKIDADVDILISFSYDYAISNIKARENIIKLLILTDNDYDINNDYSEWDIIISNENNLINKFKKDGTINYYYIDDFSFLGENIINILKKQFLGI